MLDNGPINLLNADTLKPKGTPITRHHKQYSSGELPVFIISAEQAKFEIADNMTFTAGLQACLENDKIPFKAVRGSYKGIEERAFVVNCSLTQALTFAEIFHQESVLHLDTSRNATLHYTFNKPTNVDVTKEKIGRFVACSEEEARAGQAWTYDIGQDTYYHVV